jgi:hypothetical protein
VGRVVIRLRRWRMEVVCEKGREEGGGGSLVREAMVIAAIGGVGG